MVLLIQRRAEDVNIGALEALAGTQDVHGVFKTTAHFSVDDIIKSNQRIPREWGPWFAHMVLLERQNCDNEVQNPYNV